ncbi:MAG: class I SAM-dependent methyltransferase [Actinomycetota bacterium]|nr:class I SAM-dependent methyltransferase [Actinomycetota bacterium]MDQ2957202.1 class I SAM-dependent methyltransferase [Actinomycetota bacterium]
MDDYRALNRANWDERAPAHAASSGYAFRQFAEDPAFLSEVVRFDRDRLGDLTGLRGIHLQCHIGTDTLSLQRLGARMTGLDFSPAALLEARRLVAEVGAELEFVEADAYQAAEILGAGQFDLVYTGIGALCWLPDIARWGQLVGQLLKPGGRLFIREGHPMLWAVDDTQLDRLVIDYPYFETVKPVLFEEPGTYVETDVEFEHNWSASWNHGLGEIITSLFAAGLHLTAFEEHDSVPWCALPGRMTELGGGEWRLTDRPERLPHSYTLQAVKPAN